jgi:hypothetical protein
VSFLKLRAEPENRFESLARRTNTKREVRQSRNLAECSILQSQQPLVNVSGRLAGGRHLHLLKRTTELARCVRPYGTEFGESGICYHGELTQRGVCRGRESLALYPSNTTMKNREKCPDQRKFDAQFANAPIDVGYHRNAVTDARHVGGRTDKQGDRACR